MAKALPQSYEPTNPPIEFEDWHRWIDDELHRISFALQSNPVVVALDGNGVIDIDVIPNTEVLGIGDTPAIDFPGGAASSYITVTELAA